LNKPESWQRKKRPINWKCKKGKKGTWDGNVPHSISFDAPKAPRVPLESHPTTQLTLHTSLIIMTNIPFSHQTKPTKHTQPTQSKNNTKAFQPPREWHLLQARNIAPWLPKKIEDGGRGASGSFVGELPI
jgi:hypothetical protein